MTRRRRRRILLAFGPVFFVLGGLFAWLLLPPPRRLAASQRHRDGIDHGRLAMREAADDADEAVAAVIPETTESRRLALRPQPRAAAPPLTIVAAIRDAHARHRATSTALGGMSTRTLVVPPPAAPTRAVLSLVVNEVPLGDVFVILDGPDVLVARRDLTEAGLDLGTGGAATERVSLRSLAPEIAYQLDEEATTLRIEVDAARLPTTLIDIGGREQPRDLELGADTSLFVNYAAHLDDARDVGGFAEAGLTAHGLFTYSSVSVPSTGPAARGLSYVRWDDPAHLRRVVVGDGLTSGGQLGGGAFVGGVHLSRNFGLDPYFVAAPGLELAGSAVVPSTVEVYVNGALVRREEVAPGPVQISNVAGLDGAGVTRLVIRDALGNEREITGTYYQAQGLLAPGLDEYDYAVGFRREQVGVESFDYREPVVMGRHRRGLTRQLTAGAWEQASSQLVSGGLGVSVALPAGQLELNGAASVEGDAIGGAAAIAYAIRGRRFGASCSLRAQSDVFSTIGVGAAADRPRFDATASLSAPLGQRISLSMQASASSWRDRGWTDRLVAAANWRGGDDWFVTTTVGAAQEMARPVTAQMFVGVTMILGRRTTSAAGYRVQGEDGRGDLYVQRSAPAGRGVGYRASISKGDRVNGATTVDVHGDHGVYTGRFDATPDGASGMVTVAGGIVFIGGRVFATRPVQQGFALVRVPGVEGVRAYLNNQQIGRTDSHGDLIVSALLPYYGNRIGVNELDIPFDRAAPRAERTIAPPDRGGVVIRFEAPLLQVVRGRLRIEDGVHSWVPAYGELTVAVGELSSPIGGDGEFELDGLATGGSDAVIVWSGGTCAMVLEAPERVGSIVDLGTLECTP